MLTVWWAAEARRGDSSSELFPVKPSALPLLGNGALYSESAPVSLRLLVVPRPEGSDDMAVHEMAVELAGYIEGEVICILAGST